MQENKTFSQSITDNGNVIDVIAIEVPDPVINVKREVTIVFSKDSVPSTCTTAFLKNFLESAIPGIVQETYEFEFVEVGEFNINRVSDAYLWLGMNRVDPDAHPILLTKFKEAQHCMYNGEHDGEFESDSTAFQDAVRDVYEEIKYLFCGSDFAYHSMNQLSRLVPELDFPDIYALMLEITKLDKAIFGFMDNNSKSDDLLTGWVTMHNSLFMLGLPHTEMVETWAADELIEKYLLERRLFKDIINKSSSEELEFNSGKHRTIRTAIPDGFWMARRILSLAKVHFHNIRLVDSGYHVETNLPKAISNSFKIGQTRSNSVH